MNKISRDATKQEGTEEDLHGTDVKLLEFIGGQSVKLKFFHKLFVIIEKQYDDMASRYRGAKRL